jgi:hypothetical protein
LTARSSVDRSSTARPGAPVPLASPLVVPPAVHGESVSLHCDHYGRDGHVEAFCYRNKKAQKAQAHRSSHGTSSRGFERSSASSEIHEILIILRHLATSTSSGAVGSVTQPSALTSSATTSQSSSLGPPSTPSPSTDPWYLDSVVFFPMTPHSAHLSSLCPYHHCIVHTTDSSPLSVAR